METQMSTQIKYPKTTVAALAVVVLGGWKLATSGMTSADDDKAADIAATGVTSADDPQQAVNQTNASPSGLLKLAQKAIGPQLKDPDSAEYQNLKVFMKPGKEWVLCGQVNAKNDFGGYTGYKLFYKDDNSHLTLIQPELTGEPGQAEVVNLFLGAYRALCT
jgi:hypothetical protein